MSGVRASESPDCADSAQEIGTRQRDDFGLTFRLGVRDDSDLWVMTRTGRRTVEDRHTDWGGGDREPVHVTDPARRRN